MVKVLMVPVHLDARYLQNSATAVEPTADFRGLPYYDSQEDRDVNSDTPWLGESVVSPPFENSNMTLHEGMHLHWSLPDALCQGKEVKGQIEMPTVPNRWLVRRRGDTDKATQSWVVESDYLWPTADQAPAVNIFYQSSKAGKPYRFLGRKLPLKEWEQEQNNTTTHDYLEEPLTAVGYGEPTFAAYYPNCMTVFGFHDRDLPQEWTTLQYDLIGWYADQESSPALSWEEGSLLDNENLPIEAFKYWTVSETSKPQQFLCYASIKLTKENVENPSEQPRPLKVAVGNTTTEALSAILAKEVANQLVPNDQNLVRRIEEQLEALHIQGQLTSEVQDVGLRLREYRHQKSFEPVSGHDRWTIHIDASEPQHLPEDVLVALRHLNEIKAIYEKQQSRLEHARRQLYGDWCNYMRCVYRSPFSGRGRFLDIDEIVAYIKTRSLKDVKYFKSVVAATKDQHDKAQDDKAIETLNPSDQDAKKYTLKATPGARFWQPSDPVVVITGGKAQLNEHHGQDGQYSEDGTLGCGVHEFSTADLDEALRADDTREELFGWIQKEWKQHCNGELCDCIGLRKINPKQSPWNPLFLDWGVDIHPAESHAPGNPGDYDHDIVTQHYRLGSQFPDLQPENIWTNDNPDRFSGRCILGDGASVVLRERMEELLQQRLIDGDSKVWARAQDENYFQQVSDWYAQQPISHLPRTPEDLKNLVSWYENRPLNAGNSGTADQTKDPLYCTLLAYKQLFENADAAGDKATEPLKPRVFLSQSLGGFNEELLQWKLGLGLPIEEPIGFDQYQDFTQDVAEAVGEATEWVTEPTNNFSPIRSGMLKLDRLRLIDSFGQMEDIAVDDQVIVPSPYTMPGRSGAAFLPPRVIQPARVTFRWLDVETKTTTTPNSALQDESKEMVDIEERSPICGWLLKETLSGRLLVFDGDGNPLGAIAADSNNGNLEWVPAPGSPMVSESERTTGRAWLKKISTDYYHSILNGQTQEPESVQARDLGELGAKLKSPRLARVLLYLLATRSSEFLERFLRTLDDAMANIDPEGTTSMGSLALLVGRPVAVVGAELNLELKDMPAVRQDWDAFRDDQHRHHRDTDDFTHVEFRMRLGQYQSRNDGVLGYWLEDKKGGFQQHTFTAQAADENEEPNRQLEIAAPLAGLNNKPARINVHDGGPVDELNFTQSIAAPALQTTLLFDPRGQAHLTTGILPVKRIDIPRPLWESALEAIRVWLPVTPILSRSYSRRVPTPSIVDREWNWLETLQTGDSNAWQTLAQRPTIAEAELKADLNQLIEPLEVEPLEIELLIDRGWLEKGESPGDDRLYVLPREDRQPLDTRSLEVSVDRLLSKLSLALTSPGEEPNFTSDIEAREGWLLLTPQKSTR